MKVTQGTPKIYKSSENGRRHFCPDCGTGLFYTNEVSLPGLIDIQSATYDNPNAVPAQAHIQVAERIGWMERRMSCRPSSGFLVGLAVVVKSAGLLLYKGGADRLSVLLVHPGGPFWAKRDQGAWSIPKGEIMEGEDPEKAARREFAEELGVAFEDRCISSARQFSREASGSSPMRAKAISIARRSAATASRSNGRRRAAGGAAFRKSIVPNGSAWMRRTTSCSRAAQVLDLLARQLRARPAGHGAC